MDLNSLRTQVFEKTGIRIDTSDPIFALVALNEAVLSECVDQHIAGLQDASNQVRRETAQLIEAGKRTKKLLLQLGQTVEEPTGSNGEPVAEALSRESGWSWRLAGAATAISILSALCVVLGQAALGYPRVSPVASPVPAVVAPPVPAPKPVLTGEQIQLIQNGEKYAKMWPKLDPKTQQRIEALSR